MTSWLTSKEPLAEFLADRLRYLKAFGRLGVTYGQVALEGYLVLAG